MPVVALRRPHLRSLTASASVARCGAFKIRAPCRLRGPAWIDYFSVSEDWSTVTPGPMVELSEIFCR